MTYAPLDITPGIIKDDTPLAAKGYWADGQWVRFVRGRLEDIPGWQAASLVDLVTTTSSYVVAQDGTIPGKTRSLHPWFDTLGNGYLAAGSHKKLAVLYGAGLYDITPFRSTSVSTNAYVVTSGSPVVTAALGTNHGGSDGDTVLILAAGTVAGLAMNGPWVITVVNTATFSFTHTGTATAAGTGGGTSTNYFEISIGNQNGLGGPGYGVGGYGSGTFGVSSGSNWFPRTWSLDHFGQNLLACPRSGTIYQWTLSTGVRAAPLTNAPSQVTIMFVTPERFVVAAGAHDGSTFDPLLVRWTHQEDATIWTAAATNQAGDFRLSEGSFIIAARSGGRENLIWTDTALYAMRYLADPSFVYRFDLLGRDCGCIGPNAAAVVGGKAYWMTPDARFFVYDGGAPRSLDCPVRKFVADAIAGASAQQEKVVASANGIQTEVWWLYPTGATNENAKYVAYNYVDNVWFTGTIARTAMVNAGVSQYPVMAGTDERLFIHEIGTSADGGNLNAYAETGLIDMQDGQVLSEMVGFLPDFKDQTGNIVLTVTTEDRTLGTSIGTQVGTYTMAPNSGSISLRESGQQFKLKFERNDVAGRLRLGRPSIDIQALGDP